MLDNTLNLPHATYDRIYSNVKSARFSVEATALTQPRVLDIAHQTLGDGRTSTVVSINDKKTIPIGDGTIVDNLKVQVKFIYAGKRASTAADIFALLDDCVAVVNADLPSLLNKEV
jgi:hypothetical protein